MREPRIPAAARLVRLELRVAAPKQPAFLPDRSADRRIPLLVQRADALVPAVGGLVLVEECPSR